jgi:hypothetical protein
MLGHFYADDSQIYSSCHPQDSANLKTAMLRCIDDVSSWMASNRLQLNPAKTEFMWCSTTHQRSLINPNPFVVNGVSIDATKSAKVLGVTIDCDLSMSSHVSHTVSSCFYQLRRLKSIRRSLPMQAAATLVNSFVISRVDYCNGLLAGITNRQCDRLQFILNASARLLYGGSRYSHVTPLLRDKLHWLRFRQRISYKLCLTVYKALNHSSPAYICELVKPAARLNRCLRSDDANWVMHPVPKRKFGEKGFSVAGPSAWNGLPAHIRKSDSLMAFKSQLKTYLYTKSFD